MTGNTQCLDHTSMRLTSVAPRFRKLDKALQLDSVQMDLDGDGVITEEKKAETLHLMHVPTLSRHIVQEYAMSTTERSGEQRVVHKRMMQERELLPEFAVKEYFLHIFGKDLEEVVESLPVTWLLPVLLIALNTKLVTATMNKALTSAASILDMWTIAFFLPRVETTETLKKFLDHGDDGDDSDMCVCFRRWAMFHKETKKKQMNRQRIGAHLIPKAVKTPKNK